MFRRRIVISQDEYLTVNQFNKAMESHFKANPSFKNVHVKGEVSNRYVSPSNHLYFTLKDKQSQVPCIVYSWFRKNIRFDIEDGMKLLVTANVGVYPPHGKYQLDIRDAIEDGLGQLFVRYQQLKSKLAKEGLFDERYKKELPHFVKRIGVITSQGGAVIHDIIKTVRENWPYCQVILFPAAVQGAGSKKELVRQIRRADSLDMDVLIVGRGGGSIEDLWSFNEEEVVRCIFECTTPVISAIGHEDDVTLSDLAADRRASTPTMAASFAIEDKNAILENIGHYNSRLITFMSSKIDDYKRQMEFMLSKSLFSDKDYVYRSKRYDFDDLCSRFYSSSESLLKSNRVMLEKITAEYVIRRPCKMQLDTSRSNLNELKTRLLDVMKKTLNDNRVNLDNATNKFKFSSQKLLTSKRHDLEMLKSRYMANPCQDRIDFERYALDLINDRVLSQVNVNVDRNRKNFELAYNDFMNASKGIIIKNSHDLDSVRKHGIIRNPQRICEAKRMDLEHVRNKKIIRNPYLMLDSYKNELDICKEKLDKINWVITLKKEQQKQRQIYMAVIAAVIVLMIIILSMIFGGIL